ncbi:MAG: DUF2326 domain-containing protein [bacterium]|nr:DUF2326 domain-containing protein [bacterium]
MLIEIMCDQFMDHGRPRGKIALHPGLNAVLGSESASNSIGKSTFLMIVDFAFGGKDYVNKMRDVQEAIGNHTICFAFRFADGVHYFSRSNVDSAVVQRCDAQYSPLPDGRLTLLEYCDFLKTHYQIAVPGLTFREAVGRSLRIYKRETLDEERPIHSVSREKAADAMSGLLKLFDLYAGLEEFVKRAEEAQESQTVFRKAQKFEFIQSTTKKEYANNKIRITELIAQAEELNRQASGNLLDLESFQAERLASLKGDLSLLKRQRTRLLSQKQVIEADRDWSKFQSETKFQRLLDFFPEVNLQHIKAIENFHIQLAKILQNEFSEAEEHIRAALALTDENIAQLEAEINQVPCQNSLSKAVLERYAALDREKHELDLANQNYVIAQELAENAKQSREELKERKNVQLSALQQKLNAEMARINDIISEGRKTAPNIEMKDKSYTFVTPKDGGTGTQYKSMIIFDLALLNLTCLPLIIHDSAALKHIEDISVEKILGLYAASPKQVFIALDKCGSYTAVAQKILRDTKVLQLGEGEGALFGRTWNTANIS